jgi:hypothetical protein
MGLRIIKVIECNDCGVDSTEFGYDEYNTDIAERLRENHDWIVNDILTFARCNTCEEDRLKELEDKKRRRKE